MKFESIKTFVTAFAFASVVMSCQVDDTVGSDAGSAGDGAVSFVPSVGLFAEDSAPAVRSSAGERFEVGGRAVWLKAYETDWDAVQDFSPDTRSAPVTMVHNTFDVSAYAFLGTWSDSGKPNLFYKETMTKSGSSWSGSARMIWPGADYNVRFAAVSPSTATGLSWTSSGTDAGMPVISYTVQNDVASQLDLLECSSADYVGDGSTAGSGVSLTFSHALTAVKFRVNDFGVAGKVKSVTITGVRNSGSHVVGASSWTSQSGSATYSFTGLNQTFAASGETAVTSGANTLLLMPQTCPVGATLTVVMEIPSGGTECTLEASLAGQVWAPGKEITYTLSPSDDDWLFSMVSLSGLPASYARSMTYSPLVTVKSFRQHALGFKQALPWTYQFSSDGGSTWSSSFPSWLTAFTPSAQAGDYSTGETVAATLGNPGASTASFMVKIANSGDDVMFIVSVPALYL